jgi:hypothetical protein
VTPGEILDLLPQATIVPPAEFEGTRLDLVDLGPNLERPA